MANTTERLHKSLLSSNTLSQYFSRNRRSMLESESLGTYVDLLLEKKNVTKYRLIHDADVSHSYGYEMLASRRAPNRNILLRFALVLGLSVDETQHMLTIAEVGILYPRKKRDSVILFGLKNKSSYIDVNLQLDSYGLPTI